MKSFLSLEEEREEEKRQQEYEKHKCKKCVWSKWQEGKISCLFHHCVRGK